MSIHRKRLPDICQNHPESRDISAVRKGAMSGNLRFIQYRCGVPECRQYLGWSVNNGQEFRSGPGQFNDCALLEGCLSDAHIGRIIRDCARLSILWLIACAIPFAAIEWVTADNWGTPYMLTLIAATSALVMGILRTALRKRRPVTAESLESWTSR